MKLLALPLAASVLLAVCGTVTAQTVPAADTTPIVKAIEAKDCASAARALNSALEKPSPAVLVLAGSMFEQGLCLKPSAERAARFYLRAQEQPGVPARLAALYASPAAGPDKGLALWWGQRAELPLPRDCEVAPEARQDVERFSTALGGWSAARLDGCVYVVGVLASVGAEFVTTRTGEGLPALFLPASGQLTLATDQLTQEAMDAGVGAGAIRGSAPGFQRAESWSQPDTGKARAREELKALAPRVDRLAADALKRYPRPDGLDPAWRLNFIITSQRS
ncbi:hypothetical protein ACG04Q_11090 [Roseateles sp. DXS20W]|uniref:Sel1 repeat family protein n=1 Tax=Pelomonas lactea TaxID=3299030 RepID=A0ABW7GJJ5_9BURK